MKKVLLKFFLFLILPITLTSCKKYDEGGWTINALIHLFGANKDIQTKQWELKTYMVNNIDSTSFIIAGNNFTQFQNKFVEFDIDNARAQIYFINTAVYQIGLVLSADRKSFDLYTYGNLNQCYNSVCERDIFNPEPSPRNLTWNIKKLKENELIIEATAKNHYRIVLIH